MLIHPNLGNFSPVLAAIFTAISSREAKNVGNKIGIGVANGYAYVGFFQLATKPYGSKAQSSIEAWLAPNMLSCMPYNKNGTLKDVYSKNLRTTQYLIDAVRYGKIDQASLPKKDRIYRWEVFIKNPDIISKIRFDGISKNARTRQSALILLKSQLPSFGKEVVLGEKDRTDASQLLQDEVCIPANQVWMWKNYFSIRDVFCSDQPRVEAPFLNQNFWQIYSPKNIVRSRMDYLLRHYNQGSPSVWTSDVYAVDAFDVLVNVGYSFPEIKTMFNNFKNYLNASEKSIYIEWLSPLGLGII